MFGTREKEAFAKLELEYPAIAVRFHLTPPENCERTDEVLSFCQFLKKAQTENRRFYITKEDENCNGKIPLGMAPKSAFTVSGIVGVDFELFRTPAPNIRVHNSYPVINPGTINYVEFCPVSLCDFYPDLVLCVADTRQAEILMRATSYISGDLWESKCSSMLSCAWSYAYPYLSGKVNYTITGMHHGMRRRKIYPAGMHVITIPYQKLDEVVTALTEMPMVTIAVREDEESKAELARRAARWAELAAEYNSSDNLVPINPKGN